MAQKETIIGAMEPKRRMNVMPVIFSIALIAALGLAGYFYYQVIQLKKNPQQVAQREVEALVSRVASLIVLPEGETPTVATVSDPEKLKDQPFFAKAQKGDKVLIYTNAKKAILYNPTTNKIVEVAPVNIGNNQPAVGSPTEQK